MRTEIITITIIILSLFFSSCGEKASSVASLGNKNEMADSMLNEVIQKFSLPYSSNISIDSTTLIFYGDRTFDTSFLLHLHKINFEIKGTYYEVLPNYHRNLYDVRSPNQVLFFEGYGFNLEMNMWRTLIQQVDGIISTDTSKLKFGGRDGDKYGLIYNKVAKVKGNMNDNIRYESFYKYLKGAFLDSLVNSRKPIMHKMGK